MGHERNGPVVPDELPRSPTGRVPQWVLDEQRGVTVDPGSWRAPSGQEVLPRPAGTKRRNRGRGRARRPVVAIVAALAVGGGLLTWSLQDAGRTAQPPAAAGGTLLAQAPTPGREQAAGPLGTPATPGAVGSEYRFLDTQPGGGDPVRYDPCRPIHYVTRPTGAPPGGAALITRALAEVSRATGLRFVDDGNTTENGGDRREPFQPARYGDRWAPVLITWETAAENPDFASAAIGAAGSAAMGFTDRPLVYVTGAVRLDATKITRLMRTGTGRSTARAVVLHELGHLVGLDHVNDRRQVMFPETVLTATRYGSGDLTGLAALGRGPCAPWL